MAEDLVGILKPLLLQSILCFISLPCLISFIYLHIYISLLSSRLRTLEHEDPMRHLRCLECLLESPLNVVVAAGHDREVLVLWVARKVAVVAVRRLFEERDTERLPLERARDTEEGKELTEVRNA